ncbi:hydroxymethylpyrimidine/phosphomethylpyrimidine kinase [Pseudoduganella sp. SL102]|uniref:hydroxymethylpyrimidine kinase n=1 Tax=Pseudoduganella albidiflava TaxID=321983 RepID=A0A411X3I9_9BURK|nr:MULTISPECIES: hydroxymethylpyrimidine/phosphomethylpyrimidine kinase [Pseudoduganella]QBI03606.1 hydroxymethylpyrimidine/phosphomethylpyrimidine kinase [Pseudoduganella albidiflava]WBS03860.1 hydroxymethylpyrimidine/phosphomethylpyrimidine kinase [Pseudoduganella sp. SL102]GGY51374.1 hydroxymethylpyrimidine/phosphomethylpyrimidine kinase [Pseudoduganella albidiflava]
MSQRPCVLVFAGADPSGGAGIAADIGAVAALDAHPLPVITALTVQDNNRVHEVLPVEHDVVMRQALAVAAAFPIAAVKIGIPGSAENAQAIARVIAGLREEHPGLPVVLDPVLASGHGDRLGRGNAIAALAPLLPLTTVITPNGPEAAALAKAHQQHIPPPGSDVAELAHAQVLRQAGCEHVLVTGGHGGGDTVVNRWLGPARQQNWHWPRLDGGFHGSGCTLAAAVAALLAQGCSVAQALARAQAYTHRTLEASYAIAAGQRIPLR